VDHDDVRAIDDTREGVRDRVLAARAARDDLDWLGAAKQRRWRSFGKLRRQGYDDVVYHAAIAKRIDTALENRSSPQRQQLFGLSGPEAKAAAAGGDEGRYMQGA
jgi:hypothetical protein